MLFSPKKDVFLDMLSNIAKNVEESGQYFVDFNIKSEDDLKQFSTKMKEYETTGDKYIHELIVALNKTFITPLEREDILAFAMRMDDVLDGFEECAARFEMYNITSADEYMIQYVDYIQKSVKEIAEASTLLARKKLMDIRKHVIKINDYESQCDEITRKSIKELFAVEKDPIKVIQYKDMYEMFEEIADSCENVANTLETIIMRNA